MKNTTRNKPSRRRLAQIYTEAAELVESGARFYSCLAIGAIINAYNENAAMHLFSEFFRNNRRLGTSWWSDAHFDEWMPYSGECQMEQTPRIIALLLMAELAKDGQLE